MLREIIDYWKRTGAGKIYLFENATQANFTRLVYRAAGYTRLCRETGAVPVFLDEERGHALPFTGRTPASAADPDGYDLTSFVMPDTVMKLIRER